MSYPVLIVAEGAGFRPAGYHRPEEGDLYIGTDGKLKQSDGSPVDGDRLIVRCRECGQVGCRGNC